MLESKSNHIYAYGTIGGDYTGAAFAEALRAAARCGDPVVHLHTDGGSITDGVLMITAMQQAGRPTTVVVEGLAASMGAVFMLSATRIRIARNALVMVHAASIDGGGNRRALEQQIETLHKVDDVLRAQFYRRGISRATVDGWFDGADHWFTADEAIKWGIADELTDAVATVAVARDVRPAAVSKITAALTYRVPFSVSSAAGSTRKRYDDYTRDELLDMSERDPKRFRALLNEKYDGGAASADTAPCRKRYDDYTRDELLDMSERDPKRFRELLNEKYDQ